MTFKIKHNNFTILTTDLYELRCLINRYKLYDEEITITENGKIIDRAKYFDIWNT